MLLFIVWANGTEKNVGKISIHLMLLFIPSRLYPIAVTSYFNTSHVTVYLPQNLHTLFHLRISIHLMLLFIRVTTGFNGFNRVFQYISCYCLSLLAVVKVPRFRHFNTSHVTVYHSQRILVHYVLQISIHLMLLFILFIRYILRFVHQFQYISCYCLSINNSFARYIFRHFNTSHVTVYQYNNDGNTHT